MFFLALFLFKFKITCGMLIWNLMSVSQVGCNHELNYLQQSQTLKPSARRHLRWASIHFAHASSPCSTIHSSLSFLVSGQAQQIFFFGFDSVPDFVTSKPWFGCDPGKAKVEEASCRGSPPIVTNLSRIQDAEMNGAKGQKGKKDIKFKAEINLRCWWMT